LSGKVTRPDLPFGPQQHAARESVLDGDAARLDVAFPRRLGDLAAMHHGEPVAHLARLVDRHVAFARPHVEAGTAVRHLATQTARGAAIVLGGGKKLVLGDGIDLGGLGFALPAEPAAAYPGGERRHVAAAAEHAQQRSHNGAPLQADDGLTCRLRHDALVRTLARPLADRYSLSRRA
jgi:hypothetical protein